MELQIKIPDKLIEKWRYVDLQHTDWHCYVSSYFEEQHEEKHTGVGIDLGKLEFDTYHKTCYFPAMVTDWREFLNYHQLTDEYPTILRYHIYGWGRDLELVSRRLSQYSFDVEWESYLVSFNFNRELDEPTVEMLDKWLEGEVYKIIPVVKGIFDDLYKELLALLIQEEDWLTSDTHVEGCIRSNLDTDDLVKKCLEYTGNVTWVSQAEGLICLEA